MAMVIYTKSHCPYCEKAIDHYKANSIPFVEYDAQNDKDRQEEMLKFTNGDTVVPAFVEDGVYKGSGWGEPPRGCTIIPDANPL